MSVPEELPKEEEEWKKWIEKLKKTREKYNEEHKDESDFVPAP